MTEKLVRYDSQAIEPLLDIGVTFEKLARYFGIGIKCY